MQGTRSSSSAPTIADVAREAGVSVATAGRALGNYGSVSTASRAAVDAAAARLGYRRNTIASSMVTGRTQTWGFIAAGIEDPFFSRALRGVTDVARKSGFEVLILNSDEDLELERAAVRVLDEKRVDGMIIAPVPTSASDHVADVLKRGTPIVFLDRAVSGSLADAVLLDNVRAGRMAAEYLIRMGHRRIGLVTSGLTSGDPVKQLEMAALDPYSVATTVARGLGYLSALRVAGISAEAGLIRNSPFGSSGAATATRNLLRMAHPPTALLAVDGITSLGAYQAIQGEDLSFPGEISMVGFDDLEWMTIVRPELTVVAQSPYDLGVTAAGRLLARLGGDTSAPQVLLLNAELRERESVSLAQTEAGLAGQSAQTSTIREV